MQPQQLRRKRRHSPLFQSSSSQKAGCNPPLICSMRTLHMFQSSSSQKAGCNQPGEQMDALFYQVSILIQPEGRMQLSYMQNGEPTHIVSILIQPEGRMQLRRRSRPRQFNRVSILIQPEGRMQPLSILCLRLLSSGFNPHPARRPDATGPARSAPHKGRRFNPHPARRPDATSSH